MKLETAPSVEYDDEELMTCPICDGEDTYVEYDYDKVCIECGHVRGVPQSRWQRTEWEQWWEHRRSEYSGWYGESRIRMVGGFSGVWDFGEDL